MHLASSPGSPNVFNVACFAVPCNTEELRWALGIELHLIMSVVQKNDKWQKMISQEENLVMLTEYLEKGENLILIIYVTPQGALTPINDFPPTSKNKVQSVALLGVHCWGGHTADSMTAYMPKTI